MSEQTAKSAPLVKALSRLELTGRARTHVQSVDELGCVLHPQAASALLALRGAAKKTGIELHAVSGFRDFEHQLAIWNGKFSGARALLSAQNRPLQAEELGEAERVAAILVWSALPGASRHHWGTDCDVIDRSALDRGAPVELLSTDYGPGGRYARLSSWLSAHAHHYGFFLPYDRDRGGVQPEPWHLSFAPVADPALTAMSVELLTEAVASAPLAGRDTVVAELPHLYKRYVTAVAGTPVAALAATALSREARLA
ncbi:MAG TPA: M15 family metallopeptidase [Steroidobacteraceae bacterium]|nr:M15 family metallopeptidase [Steroidobacteraceae bacterium]